MKCVLTAIYLSASFFSLVRIEDVGIRMLDFCINSNYRKLIKKYAWGSFE